MYMRSLAPFGYICSLKSPQLVKYNIHVNTRYELVNMNIYIYHSYNAFLIHNINSNAFELQDFRRLNKVCDL